MVWSQKVFFFFCTLSGPMTVWFEDWICDQKYTCIHSATAYLQTINYAYLVNITNTCYFAFWKCRSNNFTSKHILLAEVFVFSKSVWIWCLFQQWLASKEYDKVKASKVLPNVFFYFIYWEWSVSISKSIEALMHTKEKL